MAEVPDINPMRPIWPARPDERPTKRKRPIEDEGKKENKHHKEDEDNNRESGEGHLDEYV
jgi:hypothetical protein